MGVLYIVLLYSPDFRNSWCARNFWCIIFLTNPSFFHSLHLPTPEKEYHGRDNGHLQELIPDKGLDNKSEGGLMSDLEKDEEEDKPQFQWWQGNFKDKDWDFQDKDAGMTSDLAKKTESTPPVIFSNIFLILSW